MGTARMGRDPRTSVLNAWKQLHDGPNVFVTDTAGIVLMVVRVGVLVLAPD
jgi:choline dehydrogenase-like flavoprotein